MSKNTFYVTTPIYYVTAKPHLGSLYSTLLADVLARWNKKLGKEVFFLTGTDEHGQKVAQAAQKEKKSPKDFVDQFIPEYKKIWKLFNIEYSHFIRTTDESHTHVVQQVIQQLMNQGDIYKGMYQGWYCTPCETFVTEKECDKEHPSCPSCERALVQVEEETYFFRLSKYEKKLLQYYKEHVDFISPKERANEVIRFVESGLQDISISRTTVTWGVPFPGDEKHVLYVWIEALCNYITGIGYGATKNEKKDCFEKYWPANKQVLGKDIIRFHAIYWPALIMALQLPLPKQLLVHGWITIDKEKMSKSRGNIVDPQELAKTYGVDQVRYYLIRQIPVTQDGNFSTADLEKRITTELANDLGNLLQRTILLAHKYDLHIVTPPASWSRDALALHVACTEFLSLFITYMDKNQFHVALGCLGEYIGKVNAYFHNQEPWKKVKIDTSLFSEIISVTVHSLYVIAHLLSAVMPHKMKLLLERLGKVETLEKTLQELDLAVWNKTFTITSGDVLFKKFEPAKIDTSTIGKDKKMNTVEHTSTTITFDDFAKVEICVGMIMECTVVPDSEKLLQLQVDFGKLGVRQIVSGIKQWYKPEDLISKQAVFACNIKPRKIFGLESHGMIMLATDSDGKPQLVSPVSVVTNGTRLK